jgi:hypothetical protein
MVPHLANVVDLGGRRHMIAFEAITAERILCQEPGAKLLPNAVITPGRGRSAATVVVARGWRVSRSVDWGADRHVTPGSALEEAAVSFY